MDFRPDYKRAFDLNFNISDCIYETLHSKGGTKRDFVPLTGKIESKFRDVSCLATTSPAKRLL